MITTYLPPRRPRALAEAHVCPVPRCTVLVSPGHIACPWHWTRVPRLQRSMLVPAFRRREQDPQAYQAAVALGERLVLAQNT